MQVKATCTFANSRFISRVEERFKTAFAILFGRVTFLRSHARSFGAPGRMIRGRLNLSTAPVSARSLTAKGCQRKGWTVRCAMRRCLGRPELDVGLIGAPWCTSQNLRFIQVQTLKHHLMACLRIRKPP